MAAPANLSSANSSMSSSPKDSKKSAPKNEEPPKVEVSTATSEAPADTKPATTNAPLAPPPKPQTTSDGPDYFSQSHSSGNPFSLEPNVFDQSFAGPSVDTPGRTVLPPVANITSPSPLPGITPGWQSLRSGPLSPAMLTGPAQTDYFSESFRGFPTPNESSLRTGLTPGGGGSMFPAPSPNTQALFNMQTSVATPGTADFQQSALRAAAQAKQHNYPPTSAPTTQPETTTAMGQPNGFQTAPQARGQSDPFGSHDVSNAANDLLSFAQQNQNGAARNGVQPFAMPNPPAPVSNMGHMPVQPVDNNNGRRDTKGSINSINSMAGSADTADFSESGQSEQKTTTRSRAKKGTTNGNSRAGNKRKADEPAKGNSRKKPNNGAPSLNSMDDDSDEDTSPKPEDGKKMTDEEKRKNFLERNRVAALKCRQRKKQWLANLQNKVELFSAENDTLTATVAQLREEIVNLKTVLLAHKECPVSISQGISGMNMNAFLGGDPVHQNPYGIAQMAPNGMPMGMPMQAGAQMQNRFVYPLSREGKTEDAENPPFPQNPYLRPVS